MAVFTISVHLGIVSFPDFLRNAANSLTHICDSTSLSVTPPVCFSLYMCSLIGPRDWYEAMLLNTENVQLDFCYLTNYLKGLADLADFDKFRDI